MLSRIVFYSRNVWMASKPVVMQQLVRPMSAKINTNITIDPPNVPELLDEGPAEVTHYDPKKESLEDFLNIRFGPEMATINDDKKPERDIKNFPRILPPIWPDRTRLYLIPESWFTYFYNKTGVTGPYVFGTTFITFLLSKEIYVITHEFINGVCLAILTGGLIYKFGPQIREYLCSHQDYEVEVWDKWQNGMNQYLKNWIESENQSQANARENTILFAAKRENVKLQLEAEFRRRQMVVYNEVRNRLEYMIGRQVAERQYQQKHMVNWIIDSVAKSITPDQEREALQKCLTDLKLLSTKHQI